MLRCRPAQLSTAASQGKSTRRARKARGLSSDEEEVEVPPLYSDGEDEDAASEVEDDEADDDEEDDEELDLVDASLSDPTTRLFQRLKDRDYDDEVEDVDDDEDGTSLARIDDSDEMSRRARRRKSQYDRANEDVSIPGVDEDDGAVVGEPEGERKALAALDPAGGPADDIDAIMGGAFEESGGVEDPLANLDAAEDAEAVEAEALPSRAAQHRPGLTPGRDLEEETEASVDAADDDMEHVSEYPDPPLRSYRLGDLLEMCDYDLPQSNIRELEVSGIQNFASEVTEGDLYVCTFDGEYNAYLFVEEAIENGAVAIISEQELVEEGDADALNVPVVLVDDSNEALRRLARTFYNDPSSKMLVVGVTGSKGKTTTSWLVRGIFEEMMKVTGMVGTIEHSLAIDKLTPDGDLWKPAEEDTTLDRECSTAFHLSPYEGKYQPPDATPDSLRVQKLMAGMADRGATACVYEIDQNALETGWTRYVDVDVAVFMGFTTEELEARGSIEEMLEEQWEVFGALKDPLRQTAVVNIDDEYHEAILEFAKEVPTVTFSAVKPEADVHVVSADFSMWETEITIATPAGQLSLSSTLIGRHNLPNILAAVATGLALTVDGDGVPLKAIVQGIEATEIIPGRCEVIDEEQSFGVVVDAAATPEQLSRLLDSVRETDAKRVILVFGCEGERDKMARPFMGEIAHWKADIVILTNDNPRGERPATIIGDIVAGYPDDILAFNSMQPYPPGFLQDPARLPVEALEFSWHNCYEYRRYVMEDRWTAIRWAIGTAQRQDCVVIAGKGHHDFQEFDLGEGIERGWFDDRVECRNALSKVSRLNRHTRELDRKELPWMEPDERADNTRVFNFEADRNTPGD